MSERLHIRSAAGARKKPKRVGRGAGSTFGSTCGRGDKGQKSRSGGGVSAEFEGGQMPLQRRLPKRGFRSMTPNKTAEVRLSELSQFDGQTLDIDMLKKHRVIPKAAQHAKVINSGQITGKVNLKGIRITESAKAAIEACGGSVQE